MLLLGYLPVKTVCVKGTIPVCFLETAHLIGYWKVNAVESYVLRAASILDRIKARTGAYPETLPTAIMGEPPSLFRDYDTPRLGLGRLADSRR
jgi:hypothetical protein